jgi:ubiquinone/menaquinone biosynthesis C-methylase UbiE
MINNDSYENPFLNIKEPKAWGPGSFEMAKSLVESTNIKAGMRVLEVGGGSGQIATTIAKYWNVSVVTLEPWSDGTEIQSYAKEQNVENQVLALKTKAQSMPFASGTFDAIISIGSFEMIGIDRPVALSEMIRVAKTGARVGIAEPMCLPGPIPADIPDSETKRSFQECFATLSWNRNLFSDQGLKIVDSYYFDDAYQWWREYRDQRRISESEQQFITQDNGRWISLGLVVGKKQ